MKQKTMDIILIILGIATLVFIVVMIRIFLIVGSVPDSIVYSFFAAVTGEAGFMGWIKTAKVRTKEREWELEDRALQLKKEEQRIQYMKDLLAQQEEVKQNDT